MLNLVPQVWTGKYSFGVSGFGFDSRVYACARKLNCSIYGPELLDLCYTYNHSDGCGYDYWYPPKNDPIILITLGEA